VCGQINGVRVQPRGSHLALVAFIERRAVAEVRVCLWAEGTITTLQCANGRLCCRFFTSSAVTQEGLGNASERVDR
jgi:hypothetical protein